MAEDPLRTKLCDLLGVELPIISFTHCKQVAVAVINAGGFAVLGEAMCTPDEIAADIRWLREHVGGRPFGIDLVLPATAPPSGTPEEFLAQIPETHREFARYIEEKYDVPAPKGPVALHRWGGLNQEMGRAQAELLLDERVPVIASGLGRPRGPDPPGPPAARDRRGCHRRPGLRRRRTHRGDGDLLPGVVEFLSYSNHLRHISTIARSTVWAQ